MQSILGGITGVKVQRRVRIFAGRDVYTTGRFWVQLGSQYIRAREEGAAVLPYNTKEH